VEVRALPTLYEARGDFQLTVEALRRAGLGKLFEAFTRLKEKLEKEGLFAPERKRPLPAFPKRLGIVTSPTGAALRDVLTTLRRRMPGLPIIIYPTQVQGDAAAAQIVEALRLAGARAECDLLILCRGGGSIEDLWPFNEESVARALSRCPIPVISGVGHETDFTIADFVADRRAPTPTGAAELATPDRAELLRKLQAGQGHLHRLMSRMLEARMQHLDYLSRRLVHPGQRIAQQSQHLTHLGQRLGAGLALALAKNRQRLERTAPRLDAAMAKRIREIAGWLDRLEGGLAHLNPHAVLERGYSLVMGKEGIVRDSTRLQKGEDIRLMFAKGHAQATVTSTSGEGQ
jgi:exodeoxyribonuclease VII large subunit